MAEGFPIKTESKTVGVVIVNYGAARLILDHLDELAEECAALPGSRIVIVDNASPNADGEVLEQALAGRKFQTPVRLIRAPRNGGFSYGNNLGIEALKAGGEPDYYYLLNPDAFVRPGAVKALVEFMDKAPKAGFVGSRLENPDGSAQISAFRFHSIAAEFEGAAAIGPISKLLARWRVAPPQRDEAQLVDWVCGGSLMIRPAALSDAGGFDEGYFLYYEETDLMLQGKRAGWETWYAPQSRVVHLVGGTTGVKDGRAKDRASPPYLFASRRRFYRKNFGPVYAAAADMAWIAGSALAFVRALIMRRDASGLRENFARFFAARKERTAS